MRPRVLLEDLLEWRHVEQPLPASLQAASGPGRPGLPFSGVLHPLLQGAAARLRSAVTLAPEVETALLEGLARRLQALTTRTLLLELNVARVLKRLPGDTPEARFHHFSVHHFQTPGALHALLGEYPELARLLVTVTGHWLAASLELLERVDAERALLGRVFLGGREPGALTGLQTGLSDAHREGRSVAVLQFASGTRLVYKPRPLAAEARFQELLGWMNARGARHPHRVLTVLDRGTHGWVEHVAVQDCDAPEALHRFYWRQGSALALLHLLAAVDLHLENVLAAGEFPVLVDVEALFHQKLSRAEDGSATRRAWDALDRSVLAVGLLPLRLQGRPGQAGVDTSGLGGEAGQLLPGDVPMLEDAARDTMRLVRRPGRTVGAHNRPRVQGTPVEAARFTEDLVQGFEETYLLLRRHREALEPRLRAFASVEVRHIPRATQRYAGLLHESLHPDFLRAGPERDRVLGHLEAEVALVPGLRRLLPHEHADLWRGDVPVFTARPGERHLWSSRGACIPDALARDGLSEVLARLSRMDDADRAWQVSLLRQSMVSLDTARSAAPVPPRRRPARPAASREECLVAAESLGEALAARAIRGDTDVTWIGTGLEDPGRWRWSLAPLGTDLFDGVGGLALFLAYLARETGREDFQALARAAREPVRRAWLHPEPESRGVGAFVGRASCAYVLGHLSALWNEPAGWDEVLAGLPALAPLIDADARWDVIGGSAGCALVLLGLHAWRPDPGLLGTARRCGERLLATALPCPGGGMGWKGLAQRPLSGLSHGAAGIARALLALATATGEARYRTLAHQAYAYERSLFVPERGNWMDLREPEDAREGAGTGFGVTWCHGAPGIALARLDDLGEGADEAVPGEIQVALTTTLREGFGGGHCLCHGDLGNVEPLARAGEVLGESRWTRAARERAAHVLQQGRERGWRCGLPRGTHTPGLMMGLAGLGYGLLRLAAPERVPSVLRLAGPGLRRAPGRGRARSSSAGRATAPRG